MMHYIQVNKYEFKNLGSYGWLSETTMARVFELARVAPYEAYRVDVQHPQEFITEIHYDLPSYGVVFVIIGD